MAAAAAPKKPENDDNPCRTLSNARIANDEVPVVEQEVKDVGADETDDDDDDDEALDDVDVDVAHAGRGQRQPHAEADGEGDADAKDRDRAEVDDDERDHAVTGTRCLRSARCRRGA